MSSHLISSHLVASHLISSHRISSHLIPSHPTPSHHITPHPIPSHLISSRPISYLPRYTAERRTVHGREARTVLKTTRQGYARCATFFGFPREGGQPNLLVAQLNIVGVFFSSRSSYLCPRGWGKPSEYAREHIKSFLAQATGVAYL